MTIDEDYEMDGAEQANEMFEIIHEENEGIDDANTSQSTTQVAQKDINLLRTVQQQECLDSGGRPYTRKVVKIDKFWNENDKSAENKKTITCRGCRNQFKDTRVFNHHKCNLKYTNPLNLQYKCGYCDQVYTSKQLLSKHMMTHKPFFEGDSLRNGQLEMSINAGQTKSTLQDVGKMTTLLNESKSPTTSKSSPHICIICNTEFTSAKSLGLHRRMHGPIKDKVLEPPVKYGLLGEFPVRDDDKQEEMFECKICNKLYNKKYEEVHKRLHSEESSWICPICNRKLLDEENLNMHMQAHSTVKMHICSYCKMPFYDKKSLKDHMDSDCKLRRYACQFCGRRFSRPHEKVKHERIHTGEKPHVCSICGKGFRVSYCLTLHLRTHTGTRPYLCKTCGKRFKAYSAFQHHQKIHSDERPYKCPFCPKTFKNRVQLGGHKNCHIKPFSCTICNRPFASLYAVRSHMETHQRNNNLKFQCHLCGASYARMFALRDHFRDIHAREITKEDIESKMLAMEQQQIDVMVNIEATNEEEVADDENLELHYDAIESIEIGDEEMDADKVIVEDFQVDGVEVTEGTEQIVLGS